jgi:hypothetical protein
LVKTPSSATTISRVAEQNRVIELMEWPVRIASMTRSPRSRERRI